MDYLSISVLCITTLVPIKTRVVLIMMMTRPSPPAVLPLVMDDRTNIVISGGSRIR